MSQRNDDRVLIARVCRGDKQAFDVLVLKYQNRVIQLVSRFIVNKEDAMDVAQETFIKAYKSLPNFKGESAFYTWLYRIAVNTAKNWRLSKSRRPAKRESDLTEVEQNDFDTSLKEMASPEHLLLRDELIKTMNEAIDDLPEELRSAIVLREMEGLSYAEIAEIMACPMGTVRSRIFRAREEIHQRLAPLLRE